MIDPPRRRKRQFLWPAIISVVVVAALVLARINEQASAAVVYLDGIRSSAENLVTAASAFSALADQIGTLGRAEFETAIDSVIKALDTAGGVVAESPERGTLVGAASLFRLTVSTWESGVRTFSQGMLRSADEGGTGEEQIYAGLQQVAAADQLYQGVVVELARPDVPDPITPIPQLAFHPEAISPVALARLFAAAASASNSFLALRADLAVGQVTAQPEWVTDPSGDLVMVASEVVTIDVVVANRGNSSAPPQTLFLDLVGPDSEQTRTAEVPELAAGAQTTVSFPGLPVTPGLTYQLGVALQITVADGDASNDGIALRFFVNEPTS
jgi:hypothetical protein